jgi:hypothetical protein
MMGKQTSPFSYSVHLDARVRQGTYDRCPLRPRCTSAKLGRTVQRRWGQELIYDGLKASSTKEAKRSRDRRKWRMEDSFAQSANLHGFKR